MENEIINTVFFAPAMIQTIIAGGCTVLAAIIGFLTVRYSWKKRAWFKRMWPNSKGSSE